MPAATPGTTVVRRQLGRKLRSLRERAGKTLVDVSAAKLASEVKLRRIESGKISVKIADARAVQWGSVLDPTEADIERTVRTRLTRQEVLLGRETPPRVDVVLSEWALIRPVGTAGVMGRQRAHLCELDGQEGHEIRVLPAAAGPPPGFRGEFTLLDFDDPDDPAVVYTESHAGLSLIERPEGVARQRRVFARLQQLSVPIEEFTP